MSEKDIEIEIEELNRLESSDDSKKSGKIGELISASTDEGITLKIIERPDNFKIGQPIVIETDNLLYYCILQVLRYPSTPVIVAEKFANSPFTGLILPSNIESVRGEEFYAVGDLSCEKIIPIGESEEVREFDTIPPMFSLGREVKESEIKKIYQKKDKSDSVGKLRGFKYEIPINFEILVKKPFGIFGKTGFGKSILNKLLCLNILKHNASQLLLFDMQGEYGLYSRAEDKSEGLKFFYKDKIQIYRLDIDSTLDDAEPFKVYKETISSGDVIASSYTLTEPSILALLQVERELSKKDSHYKDLLDAINNVPTSDLQGVSELSLRALRNRISRFESYKFLIDKGVSKEEDSIGDIFTKLKEGKSIVIDFGKYGTNQHLYFFVANLITRRLYNIYSKREDKDEQLPPLVVMLEEAHKFLKPSLIHYTIFDRIAREMRKFQLTLGFIDQRPSQIDEEVFSQISNRFVFCLDDKKDMDRVVNNLKNPKKWRAIISGLRKRETFAFGDAIAVPTLLQVMDYEVQKVKDHLNINTTLLDVEKQIEQSDTTVLFTKKESDE